MERDDNNIYFSLADRFVRHTGKHIFLTGKAGTGKTTFLKHIRETCSKKMAVVAPTGVAAINAGGVTLHTFFQLPLGAYIPTGPVPDSGEQLFHNRQTLLRNLRLSQQKRELMRELELLVMDEVSMLRADLLDAIDAVLRYVRKKPMQPFGGVQILFIGDLFQLPPVISEGEWQYLRECYESPFFFDAQVFRSGHHPVYLELKKIYRQSEQQFIGLLNRVRNNQLEADSLALLNSRYQPAFTPPIQDQFITLTTHNSRADTMNQQALDRLPGDPVRFPAVITGEFSEKAFPADPELVLKPGAQVMFVKNDKGEDRRYYNGKIGTVQEISNENIRITFAGEEGSLELEKEVWHNIRYQYNKSRDSIEEEELGTFSQYPIRLAWAITIHKSQGLTFEKAIIDAGAAFAPGQVYVALSRLTNFEGLILKSKVTPSAVNTDSRVLAFTTTEKQVAALEEDLSSGEREFIRDSVLKTFHFDALVEMADSWVQEIDKKPESIRLPALQWALAFRDQVRKLAPVALRTIEHLDHHLQRAASAGFEHLAARTSAAVTYFTDGIGAIIQQLQWHQDQVKKTTRSSKYLRELAQIEASLRMRVAQLAKASSVVEALASGASDELLLGMITAKPLPESQPETTALPEENKSKREKPPKGSSQRLSLEMFLAGHSVAEIAANRKMAYSTISGHLSGFILTGHLAVDKLVEVPKLQVILQAVRAVDSRQASQVKAVLGDEYTYPEIQAVLAHLACQETIASPQDTGV